MTKNESEEVLHQMTWPPQSPDLKQIEIVWDESDRRVKEKQPTSAQHICGKANTFGKAFQVKLVERMPRVCRAVIKANGGSLKNLKYKIYLELHNTFGYYMDFIGVIS